VRPLSEFCFRRHERFSYEYDFTDRWQIEVRLEERLAVDEKWYLWHGNVSRDLSILDDVKFEFECYAEDDEELMRLAEMIAEFETYIATIVLTFPTMGTAITMENPFRVPLWNPPLMKWLPADGEEKANALDEGGSTPLAASPNQNIG
jgi:hypothetical protein